MKANISELSDDRYEAIHILAIENDVIDYLNSIEKIQIELMKSGIDAREIYEYLVTLMLNQC